MKVLRTLMIGIGASVVVLGGLAIAGSGSSSSARGDQNAVNNQVGGQQGQGDQGVVADDQSVGGQRGQRHASDQQAVGQNRRHNGQQVGGQQGRGQVDQGVATVDEAVRGQGNVNRDQQVGGQGERRSGRQVEGRDSGRRGEKRPVSQEDQSQQTQVEVVPQSGQAGQQQGR